MSADRRYRLLLRLYPRRFRERFASGMREAFAADLTAARRAGARRVARLWLSTIAQAIWFGFAERRAQAFPSGARGAFTVDWRDACRSLVAAPVVSIAAILSLALGIGANLALFTIANSLLLKPLPVREPDRLVLIERGSWTNPIWEQIRERQDQLFDGTFAWSNERFDLSAGGVKDLVEGAYASGRTFDVLGVPAMLGRTFSDRDDARGGGPDGPVAVISYGFWQSRFGGAADVIGRRLNVERVPFTIIGVAPPGFFGAEVGRAWNVIIPIGTEAVIRQGQSALNGRTTWWLQIMARLEPGQTIEQATAALGAVHQDIRVATFPVGRSTDDSYLKEGFTLTPAANGRSTLRGRYTRPLQIIMGVVGAVLLIACANIANLLLARAAARRHELSVRLALGASRARIARQLLAETLMLTALGTGLGLIVATWGSALLVRQLGIPGQTPFLDLSVDWRLSAFTIGIAATTALLFGLAPALSVSHIAPSDALKEQGRAVAGDRHLSVRNSLVVAQVALSLVLVVGGGLFLHTFTALARTPLGFDPAPLLLIDVDLRRTTAPAERGVLFDRLREAAAATPGVVSAAVSVITPISGSGWNTPIEVRDAPPQGAGRRPLSWVNAVSSEWFATYGIPITAGRGFTSEDRLGSQPVAVVNEAFIQQFFNGAHAPGREFKAGQVVSGGMDALQVVGVVPNSIYRSARAGTVPTIYVPLAQVPVRRSNLGYTVRASVAGARVTRDLADAFARVDPTAAFAFRRMDELVRVSVSQERLLAMLSGAFGALALVLAALGLYGVTSYSVSQRRAEIGIRMALGANRINVTALVMRRVAMLLMMGLIVGLALTVWASGFVGTLLFGLEARDTSTFVVAALVLTAIGALAGWLPARRAARSDPMGALRNP